MSSLHLQRFTGNQIAKVHQRQPEKFQNTEVSTHDLCLTYYPRKSSSDYSFVCCVCVVSENLVGQQFCCLTVPW